MQRRDTLHRTVRSLAAGLAAVLALAAFLALPPAVAAEEPAGPPHCAGYETADLEALDLAAQVAWLTRELEQCTLTARSRAISFNNRGVAHRELGLAEQAAADFTRALEADPSYDRALLNRADLYIELGRFEAAVGDLTRAIELDPEAALAFYLRGLAHCALLRVEEGVGDVLASIALQPDWAREWQSYLAAEGHYEGAVDGRFGPASEAALRAWCAG